MDTLLVVAVVILWLVVLGLAFLLLGALRAVGLLTWRLDGMEAIQPRRPDREGLKLGTRAPDFALPNIAGDAVRSADFAGRKVLLVFTQAGCEQCQTVMPELSRVHRAREFQVVVIKNGPPEVARRSAREAKATFPVLCQEGYSLSNRFHVYATPFAFLIDERGVIVSKGIAGTRQYLGFVLSSARLADGNGHAPPDPVANKASPV